MNIIPADKLTDIPNIEGWYGESFYEGDTSKSFFAGLCSFFVKQDGLDLIIKNKFITRKEQILKSTHYAKFTCFFEEQNVAEIIFDPKTPLNSLDRYYHKLYLFIGKQDISEDFNPWPYFFVAAPLKYQVDKSETVYDPEIQKLFRQIITSIDSNLFPVPAFSSNYTWSDGYERIEILHIKLSVDFIVIKGNLKETSLVNSLGQMLNSCPLTDISYRPAKHFSLPDHISTSEFCKKYKNEYYNYFTEKLWEWEIKISISRYFVFLESTQVYYPGHITKHSLHQGTIKYYFEEGHIAAIALDPNTPIIKQGDLIYEIFLNPKEKLFYMSYNPFRLFSLSFPCKIEYQEILTQNLETIIKLLINALQVTYNETELEYLVNREVIWENTMKGRKAVIGNMDDIYFLFKEENDERSEKPENKLTIEAKNLRPYEEARLEIFNNNHLRLIGLFRKDIRKELDMLTNEFPLRDKDKEMQDYIEGMEEMSRRANEGEKFM